MEVGRESYSARILAADSDYRQLEPVADAELRLAYAHGSEVTGAGSVGEGFNDGDIWWGSTAWHRSEGPDFAAHYEIQGLEGMAGAPIVIFSGFALDFQGSVDNRIDFASAVIEPLSYHAGRLRIRISGGLRDRHFDQPYNWRVHFQIVGGPRMPSRDV